MLPVFSAWLDSMAYHIGNLEWQDWLCITRLFSLPAINVLFIPLYLLNLLMGALQQSYRNSFISLCWAPGVIWAVPDIRHGPKGPLLLAKQEACNTCSSATQYHLLHSTICYTVPSATQYHLLHSTICYTVPSATQYHLLHSTICYTVPSATQYHLLHSTICYTVPSATQYHLLHSTICTPCQ